MVLNRSEKREKFLNSLSVSQLIVLTQITDTTLHLAILRDDAIHHLEERATPERVKRLAQDLDERGLPRHKYNRKAGPVREWKPISTAPKNATVIEVRMQDGTVHTEAHWAQDLSGEDQPPFRGWFVPVKDASGKTVSFREIIAPMHWREKKGGPENAEDDQNRK